MLVFLLILQYILNIKASIILTNIFLNHLENKEKFVFILIFKIGEFLKSDQIIGNLISPKVIITKENKMNYLNHPRFPSITSLKYYFKNNAMFLIFVDTIDQILNKLRPFVIMTRMEKDSIIAIITDKFDTKWNIILHSLYFYNYTNVIYLDVENFERTRHFKTFEKFPVFKLLSTSNFEKETISNIKHFPIKVVCNNDPPFSRCTKIGNETLTSGRMFNLVKYFVQYINGTIDLLVEEEREYSNISVVYNEVDFVTKFKIATIQQILQSYPLGNERFSNVLENFEMKIVVSKS